MPMSVRYESNCFISKEPSFKKFPCFCGRLILGLTRQDYIKIRSSIGTRWPVCRVGREYIYTPGEDAISQFNDFLTEPYSQVYLDNKTPEGARAIGSLIYDLIELDVISLRSAKTVSSTKNERYRRIYFKDDPFFVKEHVDDDRQAVYTAIRGIRPKAYAGSVAEKIMLFFVPDGRYQIKVSDLSKWIGKPVILPQEVSQQLSNRVKLKAVTDDNAIVEDEINKKTIKVSASYVSIPANSSILSEVGVYPQFLRFNSFMDVGENEFLEQ